MVHVELKDLYTKKYALLWCVLSFKAGLLNAAGFLFAGSYVSHVTGFGTQVGIALGHESFDLGILQLIIPISFISGGALTSFILDRKYSSEYIPNYPKVQMTITLLLGVIALLFSTGVFTTVRSSGDSWSSILFIGLLCLVCGLKNSLTTWATSGKIRTTHLTGLATDIGLNTAKLFFSKGPKTQFQESIKINYVRILILLSFSLGSCISAIIISNIGHLIFYFAFFLSVLLSTFSVLHRKNLISKSYNLNSGDLYSLSN